MKKKLKLLNCFKQSALVAFFIFTSATQAQLYQDFEEEETSIKRKSSFLLSYSNTPFSFKEANLISELPYYPEFEANLPEVAMQHGFGVGALFHSRDGVYGGVNFGYTFSGKQQSRRRDGLTNFSLLVGYELPIFHESDNHLLRLEVGFGVRSFVRPISRVDRYRVELRKTDLVVNPSLSYDINLFNKEVYLFFQTRYIYALNQPSFDTRLRTYPRRASDEVERYRLSDPFLTVDGGTRLELKNLLEFSVGLRFIN